MKEKINDILAKASKTAVSIKNKLMSSRLALGITISVAVLLVVLVIVIIALPNDNQELEWGEGITEGIPSFSSEYNAFRADDSYMTAYYTDVTTEQITEYAQKLESDCGIKFNSDKYPRSAAYNDKIIVIHYNVTEKKLSVTVSLQGDNIKQETSHDDQKLN